MGKFLMKYSDEIKKSMWQPHYPTLIKKPDISAPKL